MRKEKLSFLSGKRATTTKSQLFKKLKSLNWVINTEPIKRLWSWLNRSIWQQSEVTGKISRGLWFSFLSNFSTIWSYEQLGQMQMSVIYTLRMDLQANTSTAVGTTEILGTDFQADRKLYKPQMDWEKKKLNEKFLTRRKCRNYSCSYHKGGQEAESKREVRYFHVPSTSKITKWSNIQGDKKSM